MNAKTFGSSINSLSAARWISSKVAADNSSEGARLAGAVGPSGCGRRSYLKASDGAFAEES